jgi:hypothetical protein
MQKTKFAFLIAASLLQTAAAACKNSKIIDDFTKWNSKANNLGSVSGGE